MSDRKYAESHEWISIADDVATVGISDFAVAELTDLVYMELPAVGSTMSIGEVFGQVESVKAVSDLYAPVSGEIVETNEELPDDLGRLSDDPYGTGWVVKIKLSNAAEVDALMDEQAYNSHVGR